MRKYWYLAYDVACICIALVIALYLRHGLPLIVEGKPGDIYLLLVVTAATSLLILLLMRTHSSVWRYTSGSDLASIMIAMVAIVLVYNSTLFLISRLEMMPRSVPPMHWALAVLAMGGSRLLARKLLGKSGRFDGGALRQHVLVVGACQTAEIYLQFIKRIVQHPVIVHGVVDSDRNLIHRMFQKHPILGTLEDLPRLLEQFRVHGMEIRHVVLARALDELSGVERVLLLELEQAGVIELVHFAQHISPQLQPRILSGSGDYYQKLDTVKREVGYEAPRGYYPYVKRWFDVIVASVLLVVLSPLMSITYLAVALDVGFPVIFWQQRPGLHGRPFRLYKFRTMRAGGRKRYEDRQSHKSSDAMRTSAVGKVLRRLRWDELPQLFHIIAGTMAFVGPRPLLPEDQPKGGEKRLSVRPGVTGWAQIHGGDALTPDEKLALDLWYIRHMSLWLDLKILVMTLIVATNADSRRLPSSATV